MKTVRQRIESLGSRILYSRFDESKHPRGNEKNAGQFAAHASAKAFDATRNEMGENQMHRGHEESVRQSLMKGDYVGAADVHDKMARMHGSIAGDTHPEHHALRDVHQAAAKAHRDAIGSPPPTPKSTLAGMAEDSSGVQGDKPISGRVDKAAERVAAGSVPGESPETQKVVAQTGQENKQTTPPPPGKVYAPNPAEGKAARVGVPGTDSPPPPPMSQYRLPNLTPDERAEETKFMQLFEKDAEGMADQMIDKASRKELGNDGPNFFGTDDAKMLLPDWRGTPGPDGKTISEDTRNYRAKYNTALHQTANAIAKKAFLKYLDTVVAKLPPERQNVLVTAGGVASGKGYALSQIPEMKALTESCGAVWDTAGEQNSTELPWVAAECKKRGFQMSAAYIHADPSATWENPKGGVISRATAKGRMVCARAYADSYGHGAKNFHAWHQTVKNDPSVAVAILENQRGKPVETHPEVPQSALAVDPEKLYANCLDVLESYDTFDAAKEGGSACVRYWGPPAA